MLFRSSLIQHEQLHQCFSQHNAPSRPLFVLKQYRQLPDEQKEEAVQLMLNGSRTVPFCGEMVHDGGVGVVVDWVVAGWVLLTGTGVITPGICMVYLAKPGVVSPMKLRQQSIKTEYSSLHITGNGNVTNKYYNGFQPFTHHKR